MSTSLIKIMKRLNKNGVSGVQIQNYKRADKNGNYSIELLCSDHSSRYWVRSDNLLKEQYRAHKGCPICIQYSRQIQKLNLDINSAPEDIVTQLYLMKLTKNNEEWYKVGTSRNLTNRISTINQSGFQVSIINSYQVMVKDGLQAELQFKSINNKSLVYCPGLDGRTETYACSQSILDQFKQFGEAIEIKQDDSNE